MDRDDQTGKETIVSVLTQYRVLKFIAINVSQPSRSRAQIGATQLKRILLLDNSANTTALG